jgi:hypothetical protein
MSVASSTAAISAQNTFCSPLVLHGHFNLSIGGTFAGTVTAQRSYDNGSTWTDVEDFTSPAQRVGFEPETNVQYRVGFKTGAYTSGTANVRLSQ